MNSLVDISPPPSSAASRAWMISLRDFPYHPFLIAIFPVLTLYAANFLEVGLKEVLYTAMGVVLIVVALFGLRLFYPNVQRTAIAASYVLLWTFYYGHVQHLFHQTLHRNPPHLLFEVIRFRYFLILWVILALVGVGGMIFAPAKNRWAARLHCIGGLTFVVFGHMWYRDAAVAVSIGIAIGWLLYTWRRGWDWPCAIIVCLIFGVVYLPTSLSSHDAPLSRADLAWRAAGVLGGMVAIRWIQFDVFKITRVINTVSVLLICSSVAHLGILFIQYSPPTLEKEAEKATAETLLALATPTPQRDIYYLVFDRYPGLRTLQREFGFDNRPFYAELRKRGFILPEHSRANYPMTHLSMSCAFNMQYHTEQIHQPQWYYPLLDNSEAVRLLKANGYRYYHLGNWANFLRNNDNADYCFNPWTFQSQFTSMLSAQTPLAPLLADPPESDITLRQLEEFDRVSKDPGPKFVYMHSLLTHPPYCFDENWNPLPPELQAQHGSPKLFISHINLANQKILEIIDRLQGSSGPAPIIVLQADEGPYGLKKESTDNQLQRICCRTDILTAFCLPDLPEANKVVPDDISPVNTFRLLFREYFEADIPLLPNRIYFWKRETLNRRGIVEAYPDPRENLFIDVTNDVRASEADKAPFPDP